MAKIYVDLRRKGIVKMRFPANTTWTRTKSGATVVANDSSTKELKLATAKLLSSMNLVPKDVRDVASELDRMEK